MTNVRIILVVLKQNSSIHLIFYLQYLQVTTCDIITLILFTFLTTTEKLAHHSVYVDFHQSLDTCETLCCKPCLLPLVLVLSKVTNVHMTASFLLDCNLLSGKHVSFKLLQLSACYITIV